MPPHTHVEYYDMKILIKWLLFFLVFLSFTAGCKGRKLEGGEKNESIAIKANGLSSVEIGVITPDNKFIFMRADDFLCQGILHENGVIFIDPSFASGYTWSDGIRREVVVFSRKGTYKVVASENLETEFNNSSSIFVDYHNKISRKFDLSGSCSVNSKK